MKRLLHNLRLRILTWSLNRKVRKWNAKLQIMTDERRESFEVRDFAKRRAAGKLGWQHRKGVSA